MLRFTLHRPSQNSAVSTCCHGMACRDVSGRVHVGVRPVPASHTYEGRLALATLRCDVLAGVTGLRRVRSFHFFDPAGSLLLQPAREQTPPGFKDAPVEPGLLCDVPARILHGSGSGGSHAFDVEVLDPDHVEPGSEVGAGFLKPVFAPVAIPGFHRPIRVLTFLRRFDPRRARASLRCSRRSRSASFARKPLGLVISPVDSATATVTPRSTPTTPPVPGAGIGSGITANAICQRPARSRVMRYDLQSARSRLRLNQTHPTFGTSTLDRARLSRRTRNP